MFKVIRKFLIVSFIFYSGVTYAFQASFSSALFDSEGLETTGYALNIYSKEINYNKQQYGFVSFQEKISSAQFYYVDYLFADEAAIFNLKGNDIGMRASLYQENIFFGLSFSQFNLDTKTDSVFESDSTIIEIRPGVIFNENGLIQLIQSQTTTDTVFNSKEIGTDGFSVQYLFNDVLMLKYQQLSRDSDDEFINNGRTNSEISVNYAFNNRLLLGLSIEKIDEKDELSFDSEVISYQLSGSVVESISYYLKYSVTNVESNASFVDSGNDDSSYLVGLTIGF